MRQRAVGPDVPRGAQRHQPVAHGVVDHLHAVVVVVRGPLGHEAYECRPRWRRHGRRLLDGLGQLERHHAALAQLNHGAAVLRGVHKQRPRHLRHEGEQVARDAHVGARPRVAAAHQPCRSGSCRRAPC